MTQIVLGPHHSFLLISIVSLIIYIYTTDRRSNIKKFDILFKEVHEIREKIYEFLKKNKPKGDK